MSKRNTDIPVDSAKKARNEAKKTRNGPADNPAQIHSSLRFSAMR